MKKYIQPSIRIIDLQEEDDILSLSSNAETEDIYEEYADEALTNKKTIWNNDCWMSK